ncbi:MAG: glutaredoxin 3 [Gammaproteobacteria bacterium]|nr:glutaredoxin 3 [Gammaproteobacteria bacterium]MDE2251729.1 glutaredoxin 3 [Gammaproteobacteria bacterium]
MAAPTIEMYTTSWCGYCERARQLLDRKGAVYTEISVEGDPARRAEMSERSGRRTVPQIFIGARHVGGADELTELEQRGELDALLAGA